MAETLITPVVSLGKWSTTGVAVTMAAADTVNNNYLTAKTHFLLIAHNTGGSPYTITIPSKAFPPSNRTGNVTAQSLAAGEIRVFELTIQGWGDTANSNKLAGIVCSNAAIKLGIYEIEQ